MSTEQLFEALAEEMPVNRQVNLDGWPRPVWVWKITLEQIQELAAMPRETPKDISAYGMKLLAYSLGDEGAPAGFTSTRAQEWLSRQSMACIELIRVAREFNELGGPSEDRKKKSETTQASESSSSSAETSESDTLESS